MVDQINESVDIVVQLFDDDDNDDDLQNDLSTCSFHAKSSHSNQAKETGSEIFIVRMPEYRLNARPLYAIQKNDIQIIRTTMNGTEDFGAAGVVGQVQVACEVTQTCVVHLIKRGVALEKRNA